MTVITEAGREAVESMPSGLIVTDVALSPEEVEALRRRWEAEASTLPTSAFWVDLNRRMQDPKFRRSYIKESLRIREFDDRINAEPRSPCGPCRTPVVLPPRPCRPEASQSAVGGVSR